MALLVHRDPDPRRFQPTREGRARELAALVRVEDVRVRADQQLRFRGLHAEPAIERLRPLPRQYARGVPVHHRH